MSHSDSELNREKKKNLHFEFKHKNRRQIIKNKLRNYKLLLAASNNHIEGVADMITQGVNPNYSDLLGRSALHIAASKGNAGIVKLLLENGADPNCNDTLNNTPLHLAACTHNKNNVEIIWLLLRAGADVSKLDIYGKNPLQLVESKLQILQKHWREGAVEIVHVLSELKWIITMIKTYLKQQNNSNFTINLNSNSDVDEQMSQILNELQEFKIL